MLPLAACYSLCWRTRFFFFALDLNEIFSSDTHTQRSGETHAGVSTGWAASRRLHLQASEPSALSLLRSDPLQAAWRLHRFNGFITRSLRRTRRDYCDCTFPTTLISVCVVASRGHAGLWLKGPPRILMNPRKQKCHPSRERNISLAFRKSF